MSRAKKGLLYMVESMKAGGAERQLYEIMNGLGGEEFNVNLITWVPGDGIFKPLNYTWHQCNRRHKLDLSPILKAARMLKEGEADLVHGFLDTGNLYAVLARKLAGRGIALASERSSHRNLTLLQRIHKPWAHHNASLTIANSITGKTFLEELGISPQKIRIVTNGVDTKLFSPPHGQDMEKLKISLGLDPGRAVMICVGRLAAVKNQLGVIRAYGKSTLKNICDLVLLGDSVKEYQGELERLVAELELQNKVHFYGARKDVHLFYKLADVLVLFSRREGTPNVVLEAMSCALPCVVTDVGDCPTYVENGGSGWVIPSEDVQRLQEVFNEIAKTEKSRLKDMGKAGQKLFFKLKADKNSMIEKFKEIYNSLLVA